MFGVPAHHLNWHDALVEEVRMEGTTLSVLLDFPLYSQSFYQDHLPENLKVQASFDQVHFLSPEWNQLMQSPSGLWDAEIRTAHFQKDEERWRLELAVEVEDYPSKRRDPLFLVMEYASLQLTDQAGKQIA
ncbi:hypothetical protein [Deinococcus cellulosilyticus]|nr:hypothetical protein [Deinococcus cellulosilyticus]